MNTEQAKHTPGKWKLTKRTDGAIELTTTNGDVFAIFHGDDTDPSCWPVSANAKLAAAAPELLEFARAALDAGRLDHDTFLKRYGFSQMALVARGEALIAKASGNIMRRGGAFSKAKG